SMEDSSSPERGENSHNYNYDRHLLVAYFMVCLSVVVCYKAVWVTSSGFEKGFVETGVAVLQTTINQFDASYYTPTPVHQCLLSELSKEKDNSMKLHQYISSLNRFPLFPIHKAENMIVNLKTILMTLLAGEICRKQNPSITT
ncbi:6836_t:CDS:2, partial [Acaulospora morrowiae]